MVDELAVLGYAEGSLKGHYWSARRFLCWLENQGSGSIEWATRVDLEAYQKHIEGEPSLQDGGPVSEKTVYHNLRSAQLLFDHLLRLKIITQDPFATFQISRPHPGAARPILSREDIEKLYAVCDHLGERALLALTYGCGLRVGELERLNREDVRLQRGLLIVERGKNGKRRLVPLSAGVRRELSAYAARRTGGERAFLRHTKGGRLRGHTAQKWLKKLAKRAGVATRISVHILRHTIASHLLASGLSVEEVRTFLGHSLLATTQRYTRVSGEQIEQIMQD
ncbi:MAG: tyrosine-type recombinase/integrase [Bacteroidota bacterium]